MSNVIAISYPDQGAVQAAIGELEKLQSESDLKILDLVVVEHHADGQVQSHAVDPNQSSGASFFGALLGKIKFSIDSVRHAGIEREMVDKIVAKLPTDSEEFGTVDRIALGILASDVDVYKLSAGLARLGGEVVYTNLSLDDELKLVEAISKARAGGAD